MAAGADAAAAAVAGAVAAFVREEAPVVLAERVEAVLEVLVEAVLVEAVLVEADRVDLVPEALEVFAAVFVALVVLPVAALAAAFSVVLGSALAARNAAWTSDDAVAAAAWTVAAAEVFVDGAEAESAARCSALRPETRL